MDSMVVKMPAALSRLFMNPTLDWNLYTGEEQQLNNKKVRGGCKGAWDRLGAFGEDWDGLGEGGLGAGWGALGGTWAGADECEAGREVRRRLRKGM